MLDERARVLACLDVVRLFHADQSGDRDPGEVFAALEALDTLRAMVLSGLTPVVGLDAPLPPAPSYADLEATHADRFLPAV